LEDIIDNACLCSCAFIETKTEIELEAENQKLYRDSMQILAKTVKNFRTVASFHD
jgi:hypothetical protein